MPPPAFPIALSERIFKGKSFFPSKFLLFRWKYYIRWYPVTVRHHLKCLWFLPIGGEWPIRQISRVQNSTENFFRVKDKHSSSPCPYISVLELSHFLSFLSHKKSWDDSESKESPRGVAIYSYFPCISSFNLLYS